MVWVKVNAGSAFFSSCGEKYRLHPVSFLSLEACFLIITGAKVSIGQRCENIENEGLNRLHSPE